DLLGSEGTFDAGEPWPARDPARPAAWGEQRTRLERRLRPWRPDVALVLPFSFSSAWFASRIGASMRIGYAHELRSPPLTHAFRRRARGEMHLSDEYLSLGAPIGVTRAAAPDPLPRLKGPPEATAAADQLIARLSPGARRFAVMAPRSAYGPAREWPAER